MKLKGELEKVKKQMQNVVKIKLSKLINFFLKYKRIAIIKSYLIIFIIMIYQI